MEFQKQSANVFEKQRQPMRGKTGRPISERKSQFNFGKSLEQTLVRPRIFGKSLLATYINRETWSIADQYMLKIREYCFMKSGNILSVYKNKNLSSYRPKDTAH